MALNREQRRAARKGKRDSRLLQAMQRAKHNTKVLQAVAQNQPTTDEQVDGVMLAMRSCFSALRDGSATVENYNALAYALNTALVLGESIHADVVDVMLRARDAMNECAELHARHGRYGFTGAGMSAVAEALDLYEQMLTLCTPRQISGAIDESNRRMTNQIAEAKAAARAAANNPARTTP